MNDEQICDCVKKFDNMYLIGSSHIRILGDYFMHTCWGKDYANISIHHGDISAQNVHYKGWALMDKLNTNIRIHLPKWQNSSSSSPIALWILTGSHDFSERTLRYTMDTGLKEFVQAVRYIKTQIQGSGVRVDFRIIGTPPMPDNWYWNNFAIDAFNTKMRKITKSLDVRFMDYFRHVIACKNDVPRGNHYFDRVGNKFDGEVGKQFFFGTFLPEVCF